MSRPNPHREMPYADNVAANVVLERERRGWSYDQLAREMAKKGCPIQASAIYKIEKGTPPRKVDPNELVALALVFDLTPADLLEAGGIRDVPRELWKIVLDVESEHRVIVHARHTIDQLVDSMRQLVDGDPGLRSTLRVYLNDGWSDWPEVRAYFKSVLRSTPTKQGGTA